jgi:hypothetical protein
MGIEVNLPQADEMRIQSNEGISLTSISKTGRSLLNGVWSTNDMFRCQGCYNVEIDSL